MPIKESEGGRGLESLAEAVNRGLTASSVSYKLKDLGPGEGGQLVKIVHSDSHMEEVVLTVRAGEEAEYGRCVFVGS